MGFMISLLTACGGIDNGLTACPEGGCPTEEATSNTQDTSSDNSGGSQTFPSYTGCDFIKIALPLDQDANSTVDDICPYYFQGSQAGNYDQSCQDSLKAVGKNIISAIPNYFSSNATVDEIITCNFPVTIFYEYDRQSVLRPVLKPVDLSGPFSSNSPSIRAYDENVRLYVTIGDQQQYISTYENGDLTDPMPFSNFFFFTALEYSGKGTMLAADLTHGIANADKAPLSDERNDMMYDGVITGDTPRSLIVNDLDYATPCADENENGIVCDYTLATSGSAMKLLDEDLTRTVRDDLLQVPEGDTDVWRGGHYFPPSN